MRKLFFSLITAATFCGCNAQECKMSVKLDGVKDTVIVTIVNEQMNNYEKIDTLVVKNGEFTYTTNYPTVRMAGISTPDRKAGSVSLYLIPGERLAVTGSLAESRVGGSPIYEEIAKTEDMVAPIMKKMDEMQDEFNKRVAAGEDQSKVNADIMPRWTAARNEITAKRCEYLEANLNSEIAPLLLMQIEDEDFEKYDAKVSLAAKTGRLASLYNRRKAMYEKEKTRKENEAKLAPGTMAPDFKLPSIDGKLLALSDLRGKYVIIDFWGSWCVWCIKGMPKMKEYYDKYNSKLEILGIDCRDKEDKWKASVEKNNATWKHVRNGKQEVTVNGKKSDGSEFEDITATYAVQGYPTKVLVDPEGKIVKYMVGEDPEFYNILDEVLK